MKISSGMLKKAIWLPFPNGYGSAGACKRVLAFLSRAREQAFPGLFHDPARQHRGGALLAVLWLAAALAAIAFSLANTVRGEVERTSTAVDGLRSYYLAQAGIERGILYILWGLQGQLPLSAPFRYLPGTPFLPFSFPSGDVLVEVSPETAKLSLNTSPPLDLLRLMVSLGVNQIGRA